MSKALVVDDSKSARFSVKKLLQKFNLEVDVATSAEDALEYLEQQIPDVILMDHLMPGMDGFDATQKIKENENWKHIPIIMSTSKAGKEYETRAEELGVIGILPKPATLQEVNELLIKAQLGHDQSKSIIGESEITKIKEVAIEVVRSVTMQTIEDTINASLQKQLAEQKEKAQQQIDQLVSQAIRDFQNEFKANLKVETQNLIAEQPAGDGLEAQLDTLNEKFDQKLQSFETNLTESLTQQFTEECRINADALEQYKQDEVQRLDEVKNIANFVAAHKANEAGGKIAEEVATKVSHEIAESKANDAVKASLDTFQDSLQSNLNKVWFSAIGAGALALAALIWVATL